MIEFKHGDILEADAEALVCTVNCVGVMGRGIALQFKKVFPDNFAAYAAACKKHEVRPGQMFVYETGRLTAPRFIINFPTKRHWRGASKLADIEDGLRSLVETLRDLGIQSVAIPPLGSGLGGLNWSQVKPRIEAAAGSLPDVRVVVFEPDPAAAGERKVRNIKVPKMTAARAAMVELMDQYLAAMLAPFVTLLEVHKLMYFMQEAGEPLRLKYQKAHYGPYAENLRHLMHAVEGHLVSGYADGGDVPAKPLTLVPGAVDDAASYMQRHAETRRRVDKVAALVEGFESPYGLELLATVHWVIKNEPVSSVSDLIKRTYSWGERKQRFTPRQIRIAANALVQHGWVGGSWLDDG